MTEPEMMLECMKLAVPICLSTHDKDVDSVVKTSTALYNAVVSAGKTSPERTLSMKPKR